MQQSGPGLALRPKRAANAAFFEIPGKAIGMGIDLDLVDAVADRAFVGFRAVLVRGPVQYYDLLALGSPQGAADTAFLKVGGKAVGVGVNLGMVGVLAVRAGHCLAPRIVYMGFIPIHW